MRAVEVSERRQHPRRRVEIDVAVAGGDKGREALTFAVHDISLSGMAIVSEAHAPEVGKRLSLCLSERREQCSPDHIIEATVVRHHQGLVGIRFDSVGIHILKDIQRLLRDERKF
jgi:c-di-GMP-binding flagellar brake protein YcgR